MKPFVVTLVDNDGDPWCREFVCMALDYDHAKSVFLAHMKVNDIYGKIDRIDTAPSSHYLCMNNIGYVID